MVQSVQQCKKQRRLPFLYDAMHEKHSTGAGVRGSAREIAGACSTCNKTRGARMSIILHDLAMPAVAGAIDTNLSEEMAWFGRAEPRGELHKTPELLWIYT